MTWLANNRKEQGSCKPPARVAKVYRVRAGSPCFVRRVGNISNGCGNWFVYETTHSSKFDNYEEKRGKRFIFREGDYEIQVTERYVDIT